MGNRLVSKTLGLISGLKYFIFQKDRTCQRSEEGQDLGRKRKGERQWVKEMQEGGHPFCAALFVWVPSSLPVYGKWRGTEHPRRLSYMQFPESLLLGSGGNQAPDHHSLPLLLTPRPQDRGGRVQKGWDEA